MDKCCHADRIKQDDTYRIRQTGSGRQDQTDMIGQIRLESQQTSDSRHQTSDSRQQTADSRKKIQDRSQKTEDRLQLID